MAGRSLLKILIVHSANLDWIVLPQRSFYIHHQQKQLKKTLRNSLSLYLPQSLPQLYTVNCSKHRAEKWLPDSPLGKFTYVCFKLSHFTAVVQLRELNT